MVKSLARLHKTAPSFALQPLFTPHTDKVTGINCWVELLADETACPNCAKVLPQVIPVFARALRLRSHVQFMGFAHGAGGSRWPPTLPRGGCAFD